MSFFRKRKKVISVGIVMLALLAMLLPLSAGADEHGACGDPFIPIYEIQGEGEESDFHGDVVVTEGIVTVNLQQNSKLHGRTRGVIA